MPITIPMQPVSRYHAETYNQTFEGKFLHRIQGARHNRGSLFRITVWDNRNRPNPHPGERKWTDFGSIGGDGQYLDPHNQGTDDVYTVITSAEAVVISAQPMTQKGTGDELGIGQLVLLGLPDGSTMGPYLIAQKALHDPHLEPAPL